MKMLELPYVHCVCCVPPWLQFVSPNSARISVTIPTVRLWTRDPARSASLACSLELMWSGGELNLK